MSKHTQGTWFWRKFHQEGSDLEDLKKYGIEPTNALSNDGQRFLMAGKGDDVKRIALIDCQTKVKRGRGHISECEERDANANLMAAAPELLEVVSLIHFRAMGEAPDGRNIVEMARAAYAKATGAAE